MKHKYQQGYIIQNNYEVRPRIKFLKFLPFKFLYYKKLINKVSIPMGGCGICQRPINDIIHE